MLVHLLTVPQSSHLVSPLFPLLPHSDFSLFFSSSIFCLLVFCCVAHTLIFFLKVDLSIEYLYFLFRLSLPLFP